MSQAYRTDDSDSYHVPKDKLAADVGHRASSRNHGAPDNLSYPDVTKSGNVERNDAVGSLMIDRDVLPNKVDASKQTAPRKKTEVVAVDQFVQDSQFGDKSYSPGKYRPTPKDADTSSGSVSSSSDHRAKSDNRKMMLPVQVDSYRDVQCDRGSRSSYSAKCSPSSAGQLMKPGDVVSTSGYDRAFERNARSRGDSSDQSRGNCSEAHQKTSKCNVNNCSEMPFTDVDKGCPWINDRPESSPSKDTANGLNESSSAKRVTMQKSGS